MYICFCRYEIYRLHITIQKERPSKQKEGMKLIFFFNLKFNKERMAFNASNSFFFFSFDNIHLHLSRKDNLLDIKVNTPLFDSLSFLLSFFFYFFIYTRGRCRDVSKPSGLFANPKLKKKKKTFLFFTLNVLISKNIRYDEGR